MELTPVAEYERCADLMDDYFTRLREYNKALGALSMTPEEIKDAWRREALSYARVLRAKQKLAENGIIL
jgi:hypothetical protein